MPVAGLSYPCCICDCVGNRLFFRGVVGDVQKFGNFPWALLADQSASS
jgi:hypothetical protein